MDAGTLIAGRFELDRIAGHGGMAAVYRAWDRLTGEPVAVKVLHDGGLADPERFSLEARILADLQHPAIVRHIAHGALGEGAWIALEWLDGEDLATRLAREGLTLSQSLALARRIADALGVAHARGVVHRDVKPGNVFLPGGDLARAKVLDFGIARRGRSSRGATRTGTVLGTPGYMSPEQIRGARDLDARADVFALGCLLFECLTGHPAFPGDDPLAVLARIVSGPPPDVSTLRSDVPIEVSDFVHALLSLTPESRPPDGASVVSALDALPPVEGGRPSRVNMALTAGERRLRAVILSRSTPPPQGLPGGRTVVLSDHAPAMDAMRSVARVHGARLEALAGGIMVSLERLGAATDLAARAARCALALRDLLPDGTLALVIGRDGADDDAFGRAAALLRAAPEGVRGVLLDDVAAHLLHKGFEVTHTAGDPVPSEYVLRGVREGSSGARTLLGRAVSCVGRDRELATLEALYTATADEGGASAALVTGTPGAGKSRVVREFVRRVMARDDPPEVWSARADPLGAGSAFGLLGPAVRDAAGIAGGLAPAVVRQRLEDFVTGRVPSSEVQRVAAFLAELTGLPTDPEGADNVLLRAARADAQWMTDQLCRAWEDLLQGASSTRVVLLVLEDLHWASAADIAFLDDALRTLGDSRWMVVATARPEVHEAFPDLWPGRGLQEIRLAPLSMRSSERLVRQVLGADADPAVVRRLATHAAGHPLFLEELLRAVVDGRGDTLPPSAVAMVQARVEALEPSARRVLRAASVFGEAAWRGGVTALLGGTDDAGVEASEWLDELARREVLERREPSRVPNDAEYGFRHALLREAAYAMLTESDRALGHRLAGAWLESAGQRVPLVLAEHYARGGDSGSAARWYLEAAEDSLAASDHVGALDLAGRGVDVGAAGESLGSLRLVEAEVLNWRGDVVAGARRAAEAVDLLPPGEDRWYRAASERAAALGRLGDIATLEPWVRHIRSVAPAPGAEVAAATCWARSIVHLYYNGRTDTADDALAAAEALVACEHEPAVSARLAGARAAREGARGHYGAVLAETARAAQGYDAAGDLRNACMQRVTLGLAYARFGDTARATPLLQDALDTGEALGLQVVRISARVGLARVALAEGEGARAAEHGRSAVTAAVARDGARLLSAAHLVLAEALAAEGEHDEAMSLARKVADETGATAGTRQRARAMVADLLCHAGKADEALALADGARGADQNAGGFDDGAVLAGLVYAEALEALGRTTEARNALAAVRDLLEARLATLDEAHLIACARSEVPENARVLAKATAWGV